MSKDDKYAGLSKISDLKQIDVENKPKGKHNKKKYPLHWQIRSFGLYPSKCLRSSEAWHHAEILHNSYKCYTSSDDYKNVHDLLQVGMLDEALAIYTKHHPETAEWPVRFINIQPMETTREVIT